MCPIKNHFAIYTCFLLPMTGPNNHTQGHYLMWKKNSRVWWRWQIQLHRHRGNSLKLGGIYSSELQLNAHFCSFVVDNFHLIRESKSWLASSRHWTDYIIVINIELTYFGNFVICRKGHGALSKMMWSPEQQQKVVCVGISAWLLS